MTSSHIPCFLTVNHWQQFNCSCLSYVFVSNINYVCAMETVRGRSRSKQLPFCSTSFSGHFLSKRGRYFSRSLLLSLDGRSSVSIVTTMMSVTHGFDFQLIKRQKLRQNVIEYFHFMNEMSSSIKWCGHSARLSLTYIMQSQLPCGTSSNTKCK